MLFMQITPLRFAQRCLSCQSCSARLSFIMPCEYLILTELKFPLMILVREAVGRVW